ncbi:hypothetical protein FC16_GL001697 [Loigolactobacillus coryniformis subsp. torquens DSM 20004 = KCTC 3535]|uniref:Uncharacterized protein n=1 Tax=Loigolactobacillus coryniformis subsp. coryniformis KCTC 3167 = DSM 20001 TaxID=913848 RepID=A0A0R1F153_9LACO|nr:hypothetical protein FD22_GL001667 [Loigolactobacillus coryniformis subsp. coryniformis KCTC 3167 = DSM 20001]KRK83885.1 hypothetical protein FC16_GL001697 [Loigolactobacillus coryniformis subsp. torquens DSM 20004 = KCTC 3535]
MLAFFQLKQNLKLLRFCLSLGVNYLFEQVIFLLIVSAFCILVAMPAYLFNLTG